MITNVCSFNTELDLHVSPSPSPYPHPLVWGLSFLTSVWTLCFSLLWFDLTPFFTPLTWITLQRPVPFSLPSESSYEWFPRPPDCISLFNSWGYNEPLKYREYIQIHVQHKSLEFLETSCVSRPPGWKYLGEWYASFLCVSDLHSGFLLPSCNEGRQGLPLQFNPEKKISFGVLIGLLCVTIYMV